MPSIRHHRVLVLGLGESGFAAATLTARHGAATTVLDSADSPALVERAERLQLRGVRVQLGWSADSWCEPVDLIVISPGIPPASRLGRLAAAAACPVVSELELGYRFSACPILAVTGTNGKTTTVELLTHALRGAGFAAKAAGNVGLPLCEAARRSAHLDFLVVEVSSFQLECIDTFQPLAAALLNCANDHRDRYANETDYLAAKLRLFRRLRRGEQAVLRADLLDRPGVADALPTAGKPLAYAVEPANDVTTDLALWVDRDGSVRVRPQAGGEPIAIGHRDDLTLRGNHNLENVLAALALAGRAGVSPTRLWPAMTDFTAPPHRLELVTVADRVQFIDDSKATNPGAVVEALKTCARDHLTGDGKIVLLAGGRDKQLDFAEITRTINGQVRAICLFGESGESLAELWRDRADCRTFRTLEAAVDAAVDLAQPGDAVLLSPGCASFDMFRDYGERGRAFSQAVTRRLGGRGEQRWEMN